MAVFSGVIQASVRARKWRICREAQTEMVSTFLTADWHFHSPPVLQVQYWCKMLDGAALARW